MFHLFIDESGELGQSPGSSKFFLITALCTDNLKALEKRVKREKAKLYNAGWPMGIEIKGTTLWGSDRIKTIPSAISLRKADIIHEIISSICSSTVSVHYSISNKASLSPHLINADYGIAYNYLCGCLICRAYKEHFKGPIDLTVDQRNKETHKKLKFDGYLETKLVCDCEHGESLSISHKESHGVPGLQAVDFISWALFRHYEHRDSRYKGTIDQKVGYKDDWYSWKK